MKEFKLQSNEIAYDVIGEYVERYAEQTGEDIILVSLGISIDGISYDYETELISADQNGVFYWDSDWWEGQEYIQLLGIKGINKVEVTGGIYEK